MPDYRIAQYADLCQFSHTLREFTSGTSREKPGEGDDSFFIGVLAGVHWALHDDEFNRLQHDEVVESAVAYGGDIAVPPPLRAQ